MLLSYPNRCGANRGTRASPSHNANLAPATTSRMRPRMRRARPELTEPADTAALSNSSQKATVAPVRVSLPRIAREWTRIGLTGFGGPPAHIELLRRLVVVQEHWIDAQTFQDANAACGLLPGPASTQLAILCAYRLGGPAGALIGGLGFIVPAVVSIL